MQKTDMSARFAQVRSGRYDGLFLTGWSGHNGDPDNFVGELWGSYKMPVGDTSHYENPQVDAAMLDTKKAVDHDNRVQMYHKIQATILDDAPWVFVNSSSAV